MPTSAAHLLDVARGELGQGETPRGSNRTRYGMWFGFQGPWCSMFVCWVANRASASELVALPRRPKGSAYSGDILDLYKAKGRVSMAPQPGDFVVWDWPRAGTLNDHIGIVETVYAGSIGTIEGNSPSGTTYDVVGRHLRDRSRFVRGYCHPAYVGSGPQPGPPPPAPAPPLEEDDMKVRIIQCRATGPFSNAAKSSLGWFAALVSTDPTGPRLFKWHIPTDRLAEGMFEHGHSSNARPEQVDESIFDAYTTI